MSHIAAWMEVVRRAAWAPIVALAVPPVAMWCGVRHEVDALVHFGGGAAAAYFVLRCSQIFASSLGISRRLTHYLVGFGGGCTAALFCEVAEFVSDQWLGTYAQASLRETMLDMIFGVAGAVAALVAAGLFERRTPRVEDPLTPRQPAP